VAEERERAAAKTAATAARAAKLVMTELAAARAEVEAATVADAARAEEALGGGARGGRAPDGGGSPDRRGRTGGWVDGDRGLYRRRGSPSRIGTMGSKPLSGTSVPAAGVLPSPRSTMSSGLR
jgi:hypothetical protein